MWLTGFKVGTYHLSQTPTSVMWKMEYGGPVAIQVSDEILGFLCRLEQFRVGVDFVIDGSTLAGYLARNWTKLSDVKHIVVRGKLTGALSTRTERLNLRD